MRHTPPFAPALGVLVLAAGCLGDAADARRAVTRPAPPPTPDQQARAAIVKWKGKVVTDAKTPGNPVVAADLHSIRLAGSLDVLTPLTSLRSLNLYDTRITDADLAPVARLTGLQTLNLSGNGITDAGLARLASLRGLRALYLNDTQVTDAGLRHLRAFANLQDVSLFRTRVTDEGLANLRGLNNLQKLALGGTTDRGLIHLRGLPNLRELDLFEARVSNAGVEAFQQARPKVKVVR